MVKPMSECANVSDNCFGARAHAEPTKPPRLLSKGALPADYIVVVSRLFSVSVFPVLKS